MRYRSILNTLKSGATDPDATAFLLAAGITDTLITEAINQLVIDLKNANLWNKFKAIYPFVGGTEFTHKWNLKDPRDLDVAFRLDFFGGFTHSSNGVQGNGTNGYARTYFLPSLQLINNDNHISFYSRTSTARNQIDIGTGTFNRLILHIRWGDGNLYSDCYNQTNGRLSFSNSDGTGFWLQSRISSSSHIVYKNGTQEGNKTVSTSIGGLPGTELLLFSGNSGTLSPQFYSNRQCAFISIGDGFNATEADDFNDIVQAFQTTLNREI